MTTPTKPIDLKVLLDRIEKIASSSPELARDLFQEFQAYSSHLREMERKALQAQIFVAYHGSQWAGGFIGGGGVIGLVSVFVLGRRKSS